MLLSADERSRAARFRQRKDRDDFVAAHLLARRIVAALLGCRSSDIMIIQSCPICHGPHGPPHVEGVEGVFVSWAHSSGLVAAIAAFAPCAIDLEAASAICAPSPEPGDLARLASRQEKQHLKRLAEAGARDAYSSAFRQIWTFKECLIKLGRLDLGCLSDLTAPSAPVHDLSVNGKDGMVLGVDRLFYFRMAGGIGCAVLNEPTRAEFLTFPDLMTPTTRAETTTGFL